MDKLLSRLIRSELIGLNVKVLGKDLEGMIIDETKNTIIIKTAKGREKIIKRRSKIEVNENGRNAVIDCSNIMLRPQDRLKIKV